MNRPRWTYRHWWFAGYRSMCGGWMVRLLAWWFYVPWKQNGDHKL
jgi:hypothetical protein